MRARSVVASTLFVVMLVLGSASPGIASEHDGFTATGTILMPNPATRSYGGVTEIVSPCLGSSDPDVPPGAAQGVDGYWIELGFDATTGVSDFAGRHATLSADLANDVDAWFYDPLCTLIKPGADENAYSMATQDPAPNGNEEGVIPTYAAWVVVDLYAGAAATFTLSIDAAEVSG